MDQYIKVYGAREHNLKNINVLIPKNKLVVITGISGSGKSSLAFDTLYAEGQRRYLESLSSYARQFIGKIEKPDVELIEGLSPAIAIEQRKIQKNPRSTVATVTEIYDYLRLLFARIGTPFCPNCEIKLTKSTVDEIVDILLKRENERAMILAPLVKGRKGEYKSLFERIKKQGWSRLRINGLVYEIDDLPNLDKNKKHNIDLVVDRVVIKKESRSRIAESVETALKYGEGNVIVLYLKDEREEIFSESLKCPKCDFSLPELEPRLFSFNSPYGACKVCHGLGFKNEIDPELLINPHLSVLEGAIKPIGKLYGSLYYKISRLARKFNVSPDKPWKDLPAEFKEIVLFGDKNDEYYDDFYFEGIIPFLLKKYEETESGYVVQEIEKYVVRKNCPECKGARLNRSALSVKIKDKNIYDLTKLDVSSAKKFFENLELGEREKAIAERIIKEIYDRLNFLDNVGLYYLTLDRTMETLSSGEEQRVRLATQIGSGLTGVLYVLDEPSIGLHARDNEKLIKTLLKLRDLGNTVIVVEHDESTIRSADYIIDLGPGAGQEGGYVVAQGTIQDVMNSPESITGKYLKGELKIEIPEKRRKPKDKWLILKNARGNNLKNVTLKIPLGLFVCVTGVSGSGKSTLIIETLYKALKRILYNSSELPAPYDEIIGIENIDKVINIDQSPIGRTPRSNPATYTGVFSPIRDLFASLPESKMRGYKPGRFSFNVKGGRCEACEGQGYNVIDMLFLPSVHIPCEVCKGKRYNRETLEIRYKGKNIADVLDMSVKEAYEFFEDIPVIKRKLELLMNVGLSYIKLGQPATTLSGGEAQRIKLSKELSKVATGKTLYILDEPTTGLHLDDIKKLLNVLQLLVDKGNTVIVIEHQLDVIKSADWVIDLGPEGGDKGGYIVEEGPPEKIANCSRSYTGKFLRRVLRLGEKIKV
ncbi:MAG: excinuclease ABC subunit UvrA [Candidatus Hydrothermales bacterium]